MILTDVLFLVAYGVVPCRLCLSGQCIVRTRAGAKVLCVTHDMVVCMLLTIHASNPVITAVICLYVTRFGVAVSCCVSCRRIDHPFVLLFWGAGTLGQVPPFSAFCGMSKYTVLEYYLGIRERCKLPGQSL